MKAKVRKNIFLITLFAYPVLHWLIFWLYVRLSTIGRTFQVYDMFTDTYSLAPNLIDNYVRIATSFVKDKTMLNAFFNSFYASLEHVIMFPICILVSYAFSKGVPGQKLFRVIFYLPSILSTVVMTMCFKYMFNNNPSVFVGPMASLLNGLGINFPGWNVAEHPDTVWTMIVLYCLWVGMGTNVIMVSSAMNRIPRDLSEAAKLEGCGYWRELISIYIPLIMPTLSTLVITSITCVFNFYLQPMMLTDNNTGAEGAMLTMSWYLFNNASVDQFRMIDTVTLGILFSIVMFPVIMFARWGMKKLTVDVSF